MFIIISMYFSYHNKAKQLLKNGLLIRYEFVENHNGISPALVLHFALPDGDKNEKIMPIREKHWAEYMELIAHYSR